MSFEFEIERDVTIPGIQRARGSKYPLSNLSPGESFFVAGRSTRALSGTVARFRKLYGGKFVVRASEKDGESGTRVWRLED